MTRAADCLGQALKRLHAVEDALEHENALNPDARLSEAEIALHKAITDVQGIMNGSVMGGSLYRRQRCCGDLSGPACINCPKP